jgi:hypothetical protein
VVIHPRGEAAHFARLDEHGRLPEGALIADCRAHGARYGILAAGPRLRLLAAGDEDAGSATRYLELDASALEPETRPLLGLLSPRYLVGGELQALLTEARDYGQRLRERLDVVIRHHVLPGLGLGLGRWARDEGLDPCEETTRAELEAGALVFVFRALFLLYAESAGHLPMANPTYAAKSLTRTAERAWTEQEDADLHATALWDDVSALVRRMRTGQRAWDLPAYNGDLFAPDAIAGAELLERAALPDAQLAPVLVALARDPDDPSVGADFSGLEIGHLGYVYEGLLSLRLTPADRDLVYDERADRYVPALDDDGDEVPEARAGDLVWLTDEGGRKSGGVYYTRTELVRHLVRGAVGPAFDRHLDEVRALAATDPAAAAARLFDFHVLDPACGSAHFLVEVVDELADKLAALLGQVALPAVRDELDRLRSSAGASWGAGIEDTALLKRLVLKRCVYGVDVSPMGAEIAKISLWLHSFVPGLSLAYLDHNVQRGNALIGVARPDAIGGEGQATLFDDAIAAAMGEAATKAAQIRATDDARPEDVKASHDADRALHAAVAGARAVFDLWTAQPLGLAGAREEALLRGQELVAGASSSLVGEAAALARREAFLHWPLAFAEVFARENPGFDAVVGNPPWDEVTVEGSSFYARYRPGIRRGVTDEVRQAAIKSLIAERPELPGLLQEEQRRHEAHRRYFRSEYDVGAGDPDLHRFFSARYRSLLRSKGMLAVVLPRTAFVNKGSAGFRDWLFTTTLVRRVDFLTNRRRWAFDSHAQSTIALVAAARETPAENHRVEIAGTATSAREWQEQIGRAGNALAKTAFGADWAPPLLRDQNEADLLAKLRAGGLFPYGGGRWTAFPASDFHETADRALWTDQEAGWPLWKGESYGQYLPRGVNARVCPPTDEAFRRAIGRSPGQGSSLATAAPAAHRREAVRLEIGNARLSFSDVTQKDNSRTVIACLIPPEIFLGNTAPYLVFLQGEARERAACLALMNSLPFDWQARRFAANHINFFILEGLRLPELTKADVVALAAPAARLSCPDERFAEFAATTGVEVGPLTADERAALRADIDALVARAYGLTAGELEVVFADFTLSAVPAEYRQLVRDRFAALT